MMNIFPYSFVVMLSIAVQEAVATSVVCPPVSKLNCIGGQTYCTTQTYISLHNVKCPGCKTCVYEDLVDGEGCPMIACPMIALGPDCKNPQFFTQTFTFNGNTCRACDTHICN